MLDALDISNNMVCVFFPMNVLVTQYFNNYFLRKKFIIVHFLVRLINNTVLIIGEGLYSYHVNSYL